MAQARFSLIIHRPATAQAEEMLRRLAAQVHADAAARIVSGKRCPSGQKQALLERICKAAP